jgi:hypothetical protein
MKFKSIAGALAAALICAVLASPAFAQVNVSYTVTGIAGDWTLDFSVTNNLSGAPNQTFYFFGVDLSSTNITGVPTNDDWVIASSDTPWNNSGYGGSSIFYNNVWIDDNYPSALLTPGTTTTGFDVTIADLVAPTSVNWFAFTYGPTTPYAGGGNFNTEANPGFEGVSGSVSTTPEPGTLVLFGTGLLGLIGLSLKKAIN